MIRKRAAPVKTQREEPTKSRRGRPKTPPEKRAPFRPGLTYRVSMELYERVAEAARQANRKLGEEAAYRLGRSFEWEESQVQLQPETRAILKGAAELAGRSFSQEIEYRIERMLAESALKSAVRFDAGLRALTAEELAQMIEDAVARALAGRDKQKDERL
jgi:hypothetical protein